MKLRSHLLLLLWLPLTISCSVQQNPARYVPPAEPANQREVITESLFKSDDQTLSEADIRRLLDGRILIPDSVRVAVFKFGGNTTNRYYTNSWNDEEYLKTQQSYVDTLIGQVSLSNRVEKINLMPSLMTSSRPDIIELREAAVRLQANMLLVFSVSSDIYYKYKTFKKDEAKAFATAQVILMDVRTGVIPHTSVITKEHFVRKQESDLTVEETRKRAEKGAVILTLQQAGEEVAEFLGYRN